MGVPARSLHASRGGTTERSGAGDTRRPGGPKGGRRSACPHVRPEGVAPGASLACGKVSARDARGVTGAYRLGRRAPASKCRPAPGRTSARLQPSGRNGDRGTAQARMRERGPRCPIVGVPAVRDEPTRPRCHARDRPPRAEADLGADPCRATMGTGCPNERIPLGGTPGVERSGAPGKRTQQPGGGGGGSAGSSAGTTAGREAGARGPKGGSNRLGGIARCVGDHLRGGGGSLRGPPTWTMGGGAIALQCAGMERVDLRSSPNP